MKRSAFIAIVGRPNVGKSTLLNAILGEKIAIVSSKPQTTRNRIAGILTRGEDQFVFLDTPGIHKPKTKLGSYMVKSANGAIGSSDAVILIAEAGKNPGEIEINVIDRIKREKLPSMLVLNKTDLSNAADVAASLQKYSELYDFDAYVPISALKAKDVESVVDEASKFLKESEWFFDEDMITDQPERQIAAEIVREKILRTLNEEIPHGTAVVIEEFKETKDLLTINAVIYCEKNSHKGIIIGKKGETLKTIGTHAREDMEEFFGMKVFLGLWVKVKENWRDSDGLINNFGYRPEDLK